MRLFKLLLSLATIVFLNSCCTVLGGSKQMTFTSSPPGADVFENNGVYIGTTPCTEKIKGTPEYFEFKLAGYPDQRVACPSKFNHLFWLNILAIPYGFIVDVCTNKTHTPKFSKYHADMNKVGLVPQDIPCESQPLFVSVEDSISLEDAPYIIDISR